jgi:hypothetical protein
LLLLDLLEGLVLVVAQPVDGGLESAGGLDGELGAVAREAHVDEGIKI